MRIVVLVSSCMVLSSIAYAVILTTNYMVMNKLRKESEHLSKATREVQSQLSRILLYQVIRSGQRPFRDLVLLGKFVFFCYVQGHWYGLSDAAELFRGRKARRQGEAWGTRPAS